MTQHTILESAIARRNHYQGRMAENMANIIYFTKRKAALIVDRDKMKVDTDERAAMNKMIHEADTAILRGKDNVEADEMFMEAFDELIADIKKEESASLPKKTKEAKKSKKK